MLALAAAALALGGGTAPTGVDSHRGRLTLVSIRPATGGAVVRALVAARCGAGVVKVRTPVAANGSFTLSAVKRDRAPGEAGLRRTARVRVTGRIAGAVATGTASTRITLRRGGRAVDRCKTGARTWQARAAAPQTAPGPPRASGGYFGLTSQTQHPHALVLHVDPAAQRVQAVAFDYALDCRGRTVEKQNLTPGGAISASGGFSLRERFPVYFSDAVERYRVKVDGRFTATGVAGALSVTQTARARGGGVIDRCKTGRVTFAGAL